MLHVLHLCCHIGHRDKCSYQLLSCTLDLEMTTSVPFGEPSPEEFIGNRILQNPARAPGNEEPLAWYTQNCRGTYAAAWPGSKMPGFGGAIKWQATAKKPKFPTPEEAARLCPSVEHVDTAALQAPDPNAVQATWMGHASFLVQVGRLNILTDPVWSQRCSPVQFAGPKRFVQPPMAIEDLPHVHIVTISHNHYDHLDTDTVQRLRVKFQPHFVVPKGMKAWFKSLGWKQTADETLLGKADPVDSTVHELEWWQCTWVDTRDAALPGVRALITLVPVQHWSMRAGPWDRDQQLWGGFVYEVDVRRYRISMERESKPYVRRIFHCGDTGYAAEPFTQIGKVFQRFDLALIPIGAYHPRWFLHAQHVDPAEAVQIHLDLNRPRRSLGMHWGTFILTDEPVDEPPKLLLEVAAAKGLRPDEFTALRHGETVAVVD
jgi:N-acyl-phosphatidylethanolamine-hydrolysing phospholipase D